MQSEKKVTCPYNEVHRISPSRVPQHLIRCKKQYPNIQMRICPFNATHHVKNEDFPSHISECRDKDVVEGSLFIRDNPDVMARHGAAASASEEVINVRMESKAWDVDSDASSFNPLGNLMYREILRQPPSGFGKAGRRRWRDVDQLRISRLREGESIGDLAYPTADGGEISIYETFNVKKEEDNLPDLERCSLQVPPASRPRNTEPPKLRRPYFLDTKVVANKFDVEESDSESNTGSTGSSTDNVVPFTSKSGKPAKKSVPFFGVEGPSDDGVILLGDADQLSDISSISSDRASRRQRYLETLRTKESKNNVKLQRSCRISQTDEVELDNKSCNSVTKNNGNRNCKNDAKAQPKTDRRNSDTTQRLIFRTRQLP